ncbi:trafficking protein particle complex subunit 9-like [Carassius gibelio]|uniref:trafficking protein particle complex subunit 9-like n=1 Tax=Carassius gibelio TaxID=101364 RepID=UPI0022777E61|nr:trafficking protein particle complex subunit 9-like [Carassius gibelio]
MTRHTKFDLAVCNEQPEKLFGEFLTWDLQDALSHLPLKSGQSVSNAVNISAKLDFSGLENLLHDLNDDGISVTGLHVSSPLRQFLKPRAENKAVGSDASKNKFNFVKTLEAVLTFKCSGGAGQVEGYYRELSLGSEWMLNLQFSSHESTLYLPPVLVNVIYCWMCSTRPNMSSLCLPRTTRTWCCTPASFRACP